ncbi:MAG: tRNA glutamyl-Q(34) synthetase GluQRS [Planctomycetales bacterium]|nr:tRNA glutamyl-Q(34) synthetase GluQRS [Planctomycetales bacterium]
MAQECGQQAVGRLAPSPTGALHVGNARTFLLAWLSIRKSGGRLILRVEDLDSPRIKPETTQYAIDDLHWLGLDWEEGPDRGGPHEPYVQTARTAIYDEVLAELRSRELIYPCTCSRNDIAQAASAPHWEHEGFLYPGTCAQRTARDAESLPPGTFAWRFRTTDEVSRFLERGREERTCDVKSELGDFVVAKKDGTAAYQLAVVVDDHAMDITQVVRGDDLLASTYRQLQLYQALDWEPPEFFHVPLMIGPDGHRLAKRHGDTRISTLRGEGVTAERLIGWLACSAGIHPSANPCTASSLIDRFDWEQVADSTPTVFDETSRNELR